MYLRTTKRKNKKGDPVVYYQLAHNERDPHTKEPRAKIIYNFGRADNLDPNALKRLCLSIAKVCGLEVSSGDPRSKAKDHVPSRRLLPDDLQLMRTVELGGPYLVEQIWNQIGIRNILKQILRKNRLKSSYERALLAIVANRLNAPQSKLGVWDRWLDKVYLPSCRDLSRDDMYFAMDFLVDHAAEIEKQVFFQTANLFNLEVDLIFYDTTTASFSIDEEDEDILDQDGEVLMPGLRKRGHSKEGTWSSQVVIALAVTREGFPVRCWVLPGNTADSATVARVKSDLRQWDLGRVMFVADAGMNSKENRKELAKAFGKYILATRLSGNVHREALLGKKGRFTVISPNLHVKEVIIGDGERRRRFLLCYNPSEAKRQAQHRQTVVKEIQTKLKAHKDKKATCKWAIEMLASRRYGAYLKMNTKEEIALDRTAVKDRARNDGKWVLETNDDTIELDDAAMGYKSLLIIERCFRSMKKTQIKLTPMYHYLPNRIEGHVRLCVLALLIQRVAEYKSGETWFHIREKLGTMQATEFQNKEHVFFLKNEACEGAEKLLEKLGIPSPKRVLAIFNR